MEQKAYKGTGPDMIGEMFAVAAKRCIELCAANPDLVVVHDYESGMPYCVTKAERQRMIDMWETFKPKMLNGHQDFGRLFIFGTGGDLK